jgi:catechol 2,3-dioxygenase-like lactoylglutathione lyase family enzyme
VPEAEPVADRPSGVRLATVCLDCADAHEVAQFYARLLGWPVALSEPDWVLLRDPAGGVGLSFQAETDFVAPVWPEEEGRPRKSMHLDLRVDDLETASARAVELGARVAVHQPQERVRVLLDPAGHPFCLFLD